MTIDIYSMERKELEHHYEDVIAEISELQEENDKLHETIIVLQSQIESVTNKSQRKSQVLELLRNHKTISILELANKLQITTKNISSQLTYLRTDGYQIFTDPNGKKMLVEDEQKEDEE